jgi:plastocyanin
MAGVRLLAHKLAPAAALVLVAAALGACSHTAELGSGRVLRVVMTDYHMNPGRIRVQAGELTIVVRNLGRLTHNFVLLRGNQAQVQTTPIAPGSRAQLTVILTPGTYVVDSSLFSDRAVGLYGTLIVTG